jgi:hypothetical protein
LFTTSIVVLLLLLTIRTVFSGQRLQSLSPTGSVVLCSESERRFASRTRTKSGEGEVRCEEAAREQGQASRQQGTKHEGSSQPGNPAESCYSHALRTHSLSHSLPHGSKLVSRNTQVLKQTLGPQRLPKSRHDLGNQTLVKSAVKSAAPPQCGSAPVFELRPEDSLITNFFADRIPYRVTVRRA